MLYNTQKGLAEKVCKGMVEATGAVNRGAKQRTNLGVLNGFDKSILLECGFISNSKEAKLMSQKEYRKKLVKGIVKGVAQEFGFSIQQSNEEATTEDMDLSKAVHKIVVSGVEINEVSWNHMDRMKLEYVPGLLKKLGGLDHLVEEGTISDDELWRSGKYSKKSVRSLLIKYANRLG